MTPFPPAELERFPHAHHEGLLEGWGMALGADALFSAVPWKGHDSPFWIEATKGFSSKKGLASIQWGKAQFDVLFERAAPSALKPTRSP